MVLKNCPKYQKCNAPICPLDAEWESRVLRDEDPTCFYQAESVKQDAEVVFKGAGLEELYLEMVRTRQPMSSRWERVRNALARASMTGSRMTRIIPKAIKDGDDHG